MNARTRNLILVTNQLDAVSYYVVGTLRLLLSDPLFFLLGYWYGDTALQWIEGRTKSFGRMLRQWERWFGRAAYPLVFIAPNNYICLFAGASGMSIPGFFVVNVVGTLTRLYLVRRLGEAFEAPIDDVLDFIAEHRTPLLIATVGIFGLMMLNELRQSRKDLESLADAIEEEEEEGPQPRAAGQLSWARERCSSERSSSTQASGNVSPLQNDSRSKARPSRSPRWIARAKPWETTTTGAPSARSTASSTAACTRAASSSWGSHPSRASPRRYRWAMAR